jgi:hypothetical protein
MNQRNLIPLQDVLDPVYPVQPPHNPGCAINSIYQTLPANRGNGPLVQGPDDVVGGPTEWVEVAAGPMSIKHLYTGTPNWYPYRRKRVPVGTMYEHDYSQYHTSGVGRGKRISYQYKLYPFTNRNVREFREYADYMLPYMDSMQWVKHPVITDTTLNSPLQAMPYAYTPSGGRS